MIYQLLISIFPFVSNLFAVCSSTSLTKPPVFASMMSQQTYRTVEESAAATREISYDEAIRVMSFNILSDDHPEHAWANRKSAVASMIRFHRADLIGLQEPSQDQLFDLTQILSEYDSFPGTLNPVLFRKSRFEILASGSFFLSQTPNQPGIGWDAKFQRAASWVKLRDKKMEREVYFFNAHLDYHGSKARFEGAKLIQEKIREIAKSNPCILAGDFNLFPELEGKKTYDLITEQLKDALVSAQFPHHGPTGTWSGFKVAGQPGVRPDCIFVSPQIDVYLHGILSDTFDGQFPSDHLPVVADVKIN